jgi:hypothetical protein
MRVLRRNIPWLLAILAFVAVIAISVTVGFVGAPKHEEFDWRLWAETGTALGTLLLASFTAWLATTTRQEVTVSIEEQRARDRPIVVASVVDVGQAALDPRDSATVPILMLWLKNIGLGPARDLHIRARYAGEPAGREEIIAVVAVDKEITDRPLSLSGITQPSEGFDLDLFEVEGDYADRTGTDRHPVLLLTDAGLRDEQRAAQALNAKRANLYLTPGAPRYHGDGKIGYDSVIGNNGPADAADVTLQLFDDHHEAASKVVELPKVRAQTTEPAVVFVSPHHPRLSARVTWRDDLAEHEQTFDGAYPARP